MGTFDYRAVNRQGQYTEGRVEAVDVRAATFRVQGMGLTPVSVEALHSVRGWDLPRFPLRRVTRRDILFFTEELSTLVRAGLPLDRSLTVTAELASNPQLETVIQDVLKQVKGGQSLADALSAHPKYFSSLYVNMIRAGAAGGVLDVILERLVEFERSSDELRSYLTASLVYPVLLTLVGLGSIGILFYFVIPRFASIFEDIGGQIPPATMVLLGTAELVRGYWWAALLAIVLAFVALRTWLGTPRGRRWWDGAILRVPLVGPTLLKIEVGTFARTLGTLVSSAVPLIPAVRIVQNVARNTLVAEAISKVADGAKRGEGVGKPMAATGVFPGLANHLVLVGEESGRLDSMLLQLADAYDRDVKSSVKALTSVLEPAIILVMGVVVGAIVLSMLMAIFSINEIAF